MRSQQARNKKDWERWLAAMPKALGALWSSALLESRQSILIRSGQNLNAACRTEVNASLPCLNGSVLDLDLGQGSHPMGALPRIFFSTIQRSISFRPHDPTS